MRGITAIGITLIASHIEICFVIYNLKKKRAENCIIFFRTRTSAEENVNCIIGPV